MHELNLNRTAQLIECVDTMATNRVQSHLLFKNILFSLPQRKSRYRYVMRLVNDQSSDLIKYLMNICTHEDFLCVWICTWHFYELQQLLLILVNI